MDSLPKSLLEVKRLSLKTLNILCTSYAIDPAWPKSVKINALCHCLGLSTTGSVISGLMPHASLNDTQYNDFAGLSPLVLYGLTGWTTNLHNVPSVDDSTVKQYLLQTEFLDEASLRSYKLTRPYQMKSSVHSLQYNDLPSSSLCIVRAMCNPSQSTSNDDVKLVFIVLDKSSGRPCGAYCTCTVGYVIIIPLQTCNKLTVKPQ